MTLTGTVHRFARLRAGTACATVTRVQPDDTSAPATYLVEHWGEHGPTFTPCGTWRHALDYAARVVAAAVTQTATANVRGWQ